MKYLNRLVSFDLGKYTRSYSKHFYTRRCHSYSKQLITEEEVNLQFKRYNAVFKFGHRSVLSVTGEDAESFLQSMITNDMKSLKDNKVALFGLFLNPKGRVLFDAIIVKSHL